MILWHFTRCGKFLKGKCVLVRVEIIHMSKFLPGTVEKNSSTITSSGRNRTYTCAIAIIKFNLLFNLLCVFFFHICLFQNFRGWLFRAGLALTLG